MSNPSPAPSSGDDAGGGGEQQQSAMTTMGYLRAAREWVVPTRKTSAFLSKGVLTPEEFVRAGDELVFRCPTWCWESGDPKKIRPFLPPDKQYLVTRDVPCQSRVSSMEQMLDLKQVHEDGAEGGDEEDWLVSSVIDKNAKRDGDDGDVGDDFDILDEMGELVVDDSKPSAEEAPATPGAGAAGDDEDDDDEYADMADYEDDNIIVDDEAADGDAAPTTTATTSASGAPSNGGGDGNDNLVRVRTYDLSITYDKYYQTPRVWMVGKSADKRQPLTGPEMMEDVMSDYANKTVTIEGHPHVAGPHASIHPCQHGKVMKTIVKNLLRATEEKQAKEQGAAAAAADGEDGKASQGPTVEMYLFIFLKFVSSIIPTINYDFTMDVTASTQK